MKALVVASIINFITGFEINDIKILKELGYEVHCAANYDEAREDRLNRLEELHVINHQIDFSRSPLNKNNIKAYGQLKKLFAKEKYDLVHCHTPIGGVLSRMIGARYRKKGLTMIYTAHGFHFFDGAPLKNWVMFYPVEKCLSRFTDILITINKEDYNRASKHFHAKKVQYIPGVGLDTKKYETCTVDKDAKRAEVGIASQDFVLLSVGELQDRKNHAIVIEAFRNLKAKGRIDGLKYLIVGGGENKEKYQQLIEEYGLNDHVKLLGYRADIDELCAISDCFIHPSIREGLGIAPLEGMASGLPLLCSNVNGIKDYAENGVTGITFDPRNVNEVEDAIIKISSDASFREKCASNNVAVARKFDIENTAQIMRSVYGRGTSINK